MRQKALENLVFALGVYPVHDSPIFEAHMKTTKTAAYSFHIGGPLSKVSNILPDCLHSTVFLLGSSCLQELSPRSPATAGRMALAPPYHQGLGGMWTDKDQAGRAI